MHKTNPLLVEKCRTLRGKGFTLGQIIKVTRLPKATVYERIFDIPLPAKIKERIKREAVKRITKFNRERKGRCIPGRIVPNPERWTDELIFLVTHFIFDGEIRNNGCVYQNRNIALINRVQNFMKAVFCLGPITRYYPESGVHRISYFYVELANYMKRKSEELRKYIKIAPEREKKTFLRAFFDDEGCVYKYGNNRKIRGYQHDLGTLDLIRKLLNDFDIESRIEKKGREVVVSGKLNLIKFRNKINFSKGVFINPNRKNSIWRKKLEKRKILEMAITSYKSLGSPGVHYNRLY